MTGACTDVSHDPAMPPVGTATKTRPSTSIGGPDPDLVIANRKGDVLIKHTVLKADHFPSCHNTKLTPILDGAPNFRKVDGLKVYGVAIPTVAGLRRVMATMTAQHGVRKVYWQNLREEPLVFINGNPFVVREADQPFSNLEYTGINRSRVEDMEVRLKADILAEAAQFGNRILVVHENEDLSLYDHWEPVTPADVQTPQEVYEELKADGYAVDYIRVPVTDEKAPKDEDFEELAQRLWGVPDDAAVIFNCQMGRGRTTTGMIIAALLTLRRVGSFPLKRGRKETEGEAPRWFTSATAPLVTSKAGAVAAQEQSLEARLKAGNYGAVRSLLRALEKGPEAKAVLDAVIDACSAMQNLREGIFSYRARFLKEAREKQRNVLLSVCLEYLERYYMLIAFAGYLMTVGFDPKAPTHVPFPAWMAARPELRSILGRLLRRNSMAALELHTRSPELLGSPMASVTPATGLPLTAAAAAAGAPDASALEAWDSGAHERDVVATRNGAVLGAYSILKEDNFPGMLSSKIEQRIEGAPNFRCMPSLPVFGVGMPTVEGISGVLKDVGGGGWAAGRKLQALWVNMREEPVVYVNGRPFVLREEVRPLKNMMEYEGIDTERLEAMEERLKKDVLAEALRHGGRILVAHESFEYGHYGQLYDTWEEIDHPDAVQTPKDVYTGLTRQGFAVTYFRLPVTDGASPQLSDFDALVDILMHQPPDQPVIFNCQMGIGRSTTGMAIASLVHVYRTGQIETTRSMSSVLDSADVPGSLPPYLLAGLSPRSDQEEDEDGLGGEPEFRDADDERPSKVWDLTPHQVEEQKALAAGGYVGVRRIVRLLEEGDQAKKALDCLLDAAGALLNLRVAIMKYRKPRSSYKFLRPEIQQRGAAFKKGAAYLERYLLLILFTYYLEHVGADKETFSSWMRSRSDIMAAVEAVHTNPGAALAPLPLPRLPVLLEGAVEGTVGEPRDQTRVLLRRRGRLLTRRTILKSYLFRTPPPMAGQPKLPSAPDVRAALDDLPIYSVGSLTVDGLRSLLLYLGAGPGGHATVVITDIREEMVVYVNGVPFTRRELEMPAAVLHHAGVQAAQLEEQEGLLKEDVLDEAVSWGGRILLHKEVEQGGGPDIATMLSSAPGGHVEAASVTNGRSSEGPRASEVSSDGGGLPSGVAGRTDSLIRLQQRIDDMTGLVDTNPGSQVVGFWEQVDLSDPASVMTAKEIIARLARQSFAVAYSRLPLSRERTPEAGDLQRLHLQVLAQQDAAFTADRRPATLHLVLSRTANGSSSRFVTAALASYYIRPPRASMTGAPIVLSPRVGGLSPRSSLHPFTTGDPVPSTAGTSPGATGLPLLPPPRPGSAVGSPLVTAKSLDKESGEYRGIMALCRLLPGGLEAKLTVDRAISLVRPIGDLLLDVARCKEAAGAVPSTPMSTDPEGVLRADLQHTAARQLGTHYLKRYFLLITYRCFLEQNGLLRAGYQRWVEEQKELGHLLSHLTLE